MADVITRFKLETNQFDSALRDAANGLVNITKQLSNAGKEFDKFAKGDVETARALGQVESGANNLKDKLRDLVSAYNNVAKAYNNLTKEQQKTDFGKAMAASLDQLQGRIKKTKDELYSMSDSAKKARGSLGSLNDIFGTSITKLAGWGAAIAAAKGALNVAKDAFFASEQNVDAWGSAVEESKAVYESFLTSINSGDISGFLSRIGEITNAAIEAYNALDQLGTQKTIQSPQVAVKQAEISRMRTMLQTGRYVAPADGRTTGGMKTGDILTKEQIANISKNLEQALNEVATITRSQVKTATKAIDKLYAEQAAVLGVSKQKFQQATSSWANFQDAMDKANAYEKWRKENTTYTTQTTSTGAVIRTPSYDDSKNPFREWAWLSLFKDDGERFQRLVQEIQNMESSKSSLYSQYGQAYRRINRAEGINPYGGNGGGKGGNSTESEKELTIQQQIVALEKEALSATDERRAEIKLLIADLDEQLAKQRQINDYIHGKNDNKPFGNLKEFEASQKESMKQYLDSTKYDYLGAAMITKINDSLRQSAQNADVQTLQTLLTTIIQNGIEGIDIPSDDLMKKIIGDGTNIDDEYWQNLQNTINEKLKEMDIEPININFDTGKIEPGKDLKTSSGKTDLNKIVGNMSTITGALQQLGVDVPEGFQKTLGIMQVITTILMALQSLSTITATTSALKSIPIIGWFMHNGGVIHAATGYTVPGNNFSGDQVPAMLNSGELVLNKAQQGNLLSQLDNANNGNVVAGETRVEADEMVLLIRNGAARKGVTIGEYLGL